jgi:4-alpha-glucanotransferase
MRATAGGYVHYPLDLLLEVLASESQAQQCLVIGEDLGTVPEAIRLALPVHAIHRYQVALFERSAGGALRSPGEYSSRALAVWSTHDLPTLRGWWEGEDLLLRERLQLFSSDEQRDQSRWERGIDKWRVLEALRVESLAPAQPTDGSGAYTLELLVALHRFLGRTHSALVAVQVEDLAMELDPVNVPGTDQEHPNWCRRLSVEVSALFTGAGPRAIVAGLIAGRQEVASSPGTA